MKAGSLSVDSVSKAYKHYPRHINRLFEWLPYNKKCHHQKHWVLKNLSFKVAPGEAVGIIGINGAGKSTLLKIIAGTSMPNSGSVRYRGSIAALLELGMGFSDEFSGRHNVLMSGQLMGHDKETIRANFAKIEAFAGIGEAIDHPVRTYSSGMRMRLAFSIATFTRPDILIIDEALSVGDIYFQYKCITRIRQFRQAGTTLLFVSHDPGAVKTLCDRAILLDGGQLLMDANPDTVIDYYNVAIAKPETDRQIKQVSNAHHDKVQTRSGNGAVRFEQVSVYDKSGKFAQAFCVNDELVLKLTIKAQRNIAQPNIGFMLRDKLGNEVFGTNTKNHHCDFGELQAGECRTIVYKIKLAIGLGHYSISTAIIDGDHHLAGNYDSWDNVCLFEVCEGAVPRFGGIAYLNTKISIEKQTELML